MARFSNVLETVRDEDFVEYFLFPNSQDQNVFGPTSSCLSVLQSLLTRALDIARVQAQNYIWQKDEFNLVVRNVLDMPPINDSGDQLPPHLYGVTHYGENIEDEWFIVHLLVQITKVIPGLIARVIDTDGEFILIEAADHLPQWASPEICDRRVYILDGQIHIVPLERGKEHITVVDALNLVRTQPEKTKASLKVQESIEQRIKGYPEKITELLHLTNAYVPAGVAALLKARPSLVAPAVVAFCHRDPIDMRACRAMRFFPPETRVMTQVKMSRCLYAMLLHHKFTPDRRTGWQLPPPNSPDHLAHSIGVKLACGFEILVTQCKDKDSATELNSDRCWLRYRQALKDKGYFRDLLEGSQEWTRLEDQAKQYYLSHGVYSQPSTGRIVLNLLEGLEVDIESWRRQEGSLPPPSDDSWMDVSADELDRMLEERYGTRPSSRPENIASTLTQFLDAVSGLDGVELPSDSPTVPLRQKKTTRKNPPDDENNRISFDQEAFTCAVENMLDFSVPEDKWDLDSEESGMSGYEDEVEMDLSRRKVPGGPRNCGSSSDIEDSELKQYMDQMDQELAGSTLGESFIKKKPQSKTKMLDDSFSDIENFTPVDIDMNALKNILESYQAQMGGSGPASNLLGPMGVRLDQPTTSQSK